MGQKKRQNGGKQKKKHSKRRRRPRGEYEVLSSMVRGQDVKNDSTENNNIISTGNLSDEEFHLLQKYEDMLEGIRMIQKRLGVDLDAEQRILDKMNFLVHSSKSIGGFGMEKVATKEIREENRMTRKDERMEDSGGLRQMVEENLGGSGGGGSTRMMEGRQEDIM